MGLAALMDWMRRGQHLIFVTNKKLVGLNVIKNKTNFALVENTLLVRLC